MKKTLLFLGLLCAWQAHAGHNDPVILHKESVMAPIVGDFTASSQTICQGQSVSFTDLSAPDPIRWTWTFAGGTPSSSSQQNPTVTYNTPGTFTVTLQVSNADGTATVVKTDFIKVQPNPDASFTSTGISCQATNSFDFTSNDFGDHTWLFGDGSPAISSNANPTGVSFTGLGSHFITHTLVSSDGCQSIATGNVVVTPDITSASISSSPSNCASPTGSISISVTGGTAPFSFSLNAGTTFTTSNPITGVAAGNYPMAIKDSKGCFLSGTPTVTVQSTGGPTNATVALVAATCGNSNGKATVNAVTGGTSPFQYKFDGQASFSSTNFFAAYAPGSHSVVVKDNAGCTLTKNFTITATSITAVATTTTASGCVSNNGTISVGTVTGGVSPYTYSLNGGAFTSSTSFTGLAAGEHTLVVKDVTGCTFTKTVNVANNTGPIIFGLSTTASKCSTPTGKITIGSSFGGTLPYTYSVDGSAFTTTTVYNNLAAGSHVAIIKDANGCTLTRNVVIGTTSPPTAIATNTGPVSCTGSPGTILLGSVTGGTSPYTYSVDGSAFTTNIVYNNQGLGTHTVIVKDDNGCTFTKNVEVLMATPPTNLAFTTTPASCSASNGTLTLGTVTGGTPIYSYSVGGGSFTLSTNYTNLAAGSKVIIVKDSKGCEFVTSAIIGISNPTDFTFTTTASDCDNASGSVTITGVTGGSSPYTYAVDGGAFTSATTLNGLGAGTHTITVKDNNGCTLQKTTTIENKAGPTGLATTSTLTSCGASVGSVTLGAVTGGTSPYTFSFNGSSFTSTTTYSNLSADAYPVVVKDDNGCTFATVAVVDNSNGPSITTVTTSNLPCTDTGSIIISAVTGGTPPYTFALDNSSFTSSGTFTGVTPGVHAAKVKDASGCVGTLTVTLANLDGPTDFAFTTLPSGCNQSDGSIIFGTVTGGTAPYKYSHNGGTTFLTNPEINGRSAGTYILVVKDANGCTFTKTATISHTAHPTGLTSTQINPGCGNSNGSITVTGASGGFPPYEFSVRLAGQPSAYSSSMFYPNLEAGQYTISVRDSRSCGLSTSRFLVSPSGPSSVNTSNTNSTCQQANGVCNISSVTGGTAPFQYSFDGSPFSTNTSYAGQLQGGHSVKAKDANGCTYSGFTVILNTGTVPATPTITRTGFVLTSSAPTGNQWFLNGSAIIGATGQNYTVLSNGNYTVRTSNGTCISAPSEPMVITDRMFLITQEDNEQGQDSADVLLSSEDNGITGMNVFPNPNNGHFYVSFAALAKNNYTIEVYSALGKVVYRESLGNFEGAYSKELQLQNTGTGIYSLVISGGSGKTIKKVVIY